MTSSADALPALEPLPPGLSSMWRLLRLGHRYEPSLLAVSFALALASALPDALLALWFKLLGDGVQAGNRRLIVTAAVALGLSVVATWLLRIVATRVQRRFRDKVTIALESHVARLTASIATVTHMERPEYLDRLAMLRNQVFVLDHMYMSVFSTCGWFLRLGVTLALLMSVSPVLLLLAVFAVPTVMTSAWRPAVERTAQERGAQSARLARHLFLLATTAASGKELRVARVGATIGRDRRAAWERWYGPVASARAGSALWYAAAWALFAAAFVGGLAFVAFGANGTAGNLLLVVAAGARLSAYVSATVGEIGFLRGFWMDGSRRLAWLEDYASSVASPATEDPPARLTRGITFDGVSFTYPGTSRVVLDDVRLTLPAGSVVAVVGENGAGKSTLIKLLLKLYEPDAGRILVDGQDLARVRVDRWRARVSGAFQDFFKFELSARETVGVGDLSLVDDDEAVRRAVAQAGASDVVERLASGIDTQLGAAWPGGAELSHGQWQKLALARGFMRTSPLLLVLDEPTSALDAETEHALFERYAAAVRGDAAARAEGRITVLVSHRFSTVRMADLIVVLDGARVVEVGSHDDLIARGGPYSELYAIQAGAYK